MPLWHKNFNNESYKINLSIGKIIQRCCEPIDDIRSVAACALGQMLKNHMKLEFVSKVNDLELLRNIFITREENFLAVDEFKDLDWVHAKSFMRLKPLLNSNSFSEYALEGFILSAG